MGKLKIALVSDWYYPKVGGIEYSINALAIGLTLLGHEVQIITREWSGSFPSKIPEEIKVIRVEGRAISEHFMVPSAYKKLNNLVRSGGFDVVHVHGLDSPMAMCSLLTARRAGIPTVVTNHSLVGKGHRKYPFILAGKFLMRSADAIIAVSSATLRETRRLSKAPVYLIPNGIDDISTKCRDTYPIFDKNGNFVITTVSRITKKKGVKDLVEIAPVLLKEKENLLFLIVGDGPERKKLEDMVERMNISRSFRFTGEVPRDAVLQLLEESDIFVLPSRNEAFGISILEAFSKNVPVVARNHSGVSDIIVQRKTGLLSEDNRDMARQVKDLIENADLRESLATAAFGEIGKYKWDNIASRIEEVYTRVIHEKDLHHC
jgi:glycosyltransferase involved in cell wall biosynthesis